MPETQGETPTLTQVLDLAIKKRLLDLHVSLPASIETYDGKRASVRPLLERELKDGSSFELPVITNVPVIWPRTASAEIHLPLKKGDTGTLLICERSLDSWLVAGGCVNPKDFRRHDLSDAQFIPGLKPFSEPSAFDPDRLVVKNGLMQVTLKDDGKVKLTNGTEELLDLFDQLLDALKAARTNTIFGPQPLVPPTLFTNIKTKLATLKE